MYGVRERTKNLSRALTCPHAIPLERPEGASGVCLSHLRSNWKCPLERCKQSDLVYSYARLSFRWIEFSWVKDLEWLSSLLVSAMYAGLFVTYNEGGFSRRERPPCTRLAFRSICIWLLIILSSLCISGPFFSDCHCDVIFVSKMTKLVVNALGKSKIFFFLSI